MTPDLLWHTHCPFPSASSVAFRRGTLEAEFASIGIRYRSLASSDIPRIRDAHFDHAIENTFRHGGNIPAIWALANGADTRLLALSEVGDCKTLLSLPDSGVETVADLRGKRIGLPKMTRTPIDFRRADSLHRITAALSTAGLTLQDVTLVDVELPISPDGRGRSLFSSHWREAMNRPELFALIRRDVDVIVASALRGRMFAALLGAHEVSDLSGASDPLARVTNISPAVLTVSGALVRERPDLVIRYLRCVMEAERWAREHEELAWRLIAADCGLPEEWARITLPGAHARLALRWDEPLLRQLEAQVRFLAAERFIPHPIDVREWSAAELLQQAS